MVMAPVVRGRKGEYGRMFEELRADGFARAKVDGELRMLEEQIELDKKFKHDISVVVDRLVMRADLRKRLADSIETAVGLADGIVEVEIVTREGEGGGEVLTFSEKFACLKCGTSMPELEPRIFSFNSPHGACERCTGLGSQMEIDPELVVPDPTLSLGEGALLPWASSASQYYGQIMLAIAEQYGIDIDDAVGGPAGRAARRLPARHQRRARARHLREPPRAQALVLDALRGDRPEPRAPLPRDGLRRRCARRSRSSWPSCRARPARARGCGPSRASVLVGGMAIHDFTALSVRRAREWLDGGLADRDRAPHRAPDPARDRRAPALPGRRRHRLPVAGSRGGDAVRRRGAADPARDADRLGARRRALRARRAVDRPAPARQLEADRDARAAARPRQHGARRRARRADDARRRLARRPRARAPASTAGGSSRRAPRRRSSACRESPTGRFLARRASDRGPGEAAHARAATWRSRARASTTCAASTCACRSAC